MSSGKSYGLKPDEPSESPSNDQVDRPRSAIIFYGLVHRSLRHVIDSLRSSLIEPLAESGKVDVFFHSWEVGEIHNPRTNEIRSVIDKSEVERHLPEARGVFESQQDFDDSILWERFYLKNPMRHCTSDEAAAKTTLKNFLRSLESQKRAWKWFQENRTHTYQKIITTRADLRFLSRLNLEDSSLAEIQGPTIETQPMVWVPSFHPWGGINDRFAIGNEAGIAILSNRFSYATEWLLEANGQSSEWILKEWLVSKQVRIGFLDFLFQRVRANGNIAEYDRSLSYEELKQPPAHPRLSVVGAQPSRPANRILILARQAGPQTDNLKRVLNDLGKVEIIVDQESAPCVGEVWIADDQGHGFHGLIGRAGELPEHTAWSRAMVHLSRTHVEGENVWLVEDDVAGDAESFTKLFEATNRYAPDLAAVEIRIPEEDPYWYFWPRAEGKLKILCKSFQPLCLMSSRLIRAALDHREKHGGFVFHELLFASLARAMNFRMLDWQEHLDCRACFSYFAFRPEANTAAHGISHPVKSVALHSAICWSPKSEYPHLPLASFTPSSIWPDDYHLLVKICRENRITRVVEFGSPGDSTLAFLDAGCQVVSFWHDIDVLQESRKRFRGANRVNIKHRPTGQFPLRFQLKSKPDLVFMSATSSLPNEHVSMLQVCEWALQTCGRFLLHDMGHSEEANPLAEMEKRGCQIVRFPRRKGLALITTPDAGEISESMDIGK